MLDDDGLLRLIDYYDHQGPSLGLDDDGISSRADGETNTAAASRLQRERLKWIDGNLSMPEATGSDVRERMPGNSVRVVVMLLLSCGAALGSCIQLLEALAPDETTELQSLLRLGYVFFPISTRAAGVVAVQLRGARCTPTLAIDSMMCGAIMSTFHLLGFVLPTFVLIRWATAVTPVVEFLGGYQVGILGIAVLLPMYAMQTRRDDWCVTNAMRISGLICFQARRISPNAGVCRLCILYLVGSVFSDTINSLARRSNFTIRLVRCIEAKLPVIYR